MAIRESFKSVARWLATSCAVAFSLALAMPAFGIVTVTVATTDGAPGGTLTLTLSLSRETTDGQVASMQTDVIFETAQIQMSGMCSTGGSVCQTAAQCGQGDCILPCMKDPRLAAQTFTATFPDFQNVGPGQERLRLAVLAPIPPVTFSDGVLATCTFEVPTNAPLGALTLQTDRVNVGD